MTADDIQTEGGRITKMEVDYSNNCDVKIPECKKLAQEGKLHDALDQLLALEKLTRTVRSNSNIFCFLKFRFVIVFVYFRAKILYFSMFAECWHGFHLSNPRCNLWDMFRGKELDCLERAHSFVIQTTITTQTSCYKDGPGVLYLRRQNSRQRNYDQTYWDVAFCYWGKGKKYDFRTD